MTTEHRKNPCQGASSSRLPITPLDPALGLPLGTSPKSPNPIPDRSREGPADDRVGGNPERGVEKIRSSHPERSVGSTNKDLSRRTHSSRPRSRSPISEKDTRISLTVSQIEEMIR